MQGTRGKLPVADPFLEKVNISDLVKGEIVLVLPRVLRGLERPGSSARAALVPLPQLYNTARGMTEHSGCVSRATLVRFRSIKRLGSRQAWGRGDFENRSLFPTQGWAGERANYSNLSLCSPAHNFPAQRATVASRQREMDVLVVDSCRNTNVPVPLFPHRTYKLDLFAMFPYETSQGQTQNLILKATLRDQIDLCDVKVKLRKKPRQIVLDEDVSEVPKRHDAMVGHTVEELAAYFLSGCQLVSALPDENDGYLHV
uniref:Uncharacterized protein n=1 Tax=Timema monikensis TaxID=170555 RepID=A0A7R9E9I2_9NEOP|nr:unnamed protein product [Timema monikensis]